MGNFIKKLILSLFLLLPLPLVGEPYTPENQLDINHTTRQEIEKLPLTSEDALSIYNYLYYCSYLESIYDLRKIPQIDQEEFNRIKPLIKVTPVEEGSEELRRRNAIYYRISQWASTEGTNEGLVDTWTDIALSPLNVNTASIYDLMNLQNVSPVDALAIVKHRQRAGRIAHRGELRKVPGLSGWGYSNARYFLRYTPQKERKAFHGDYQLRFYNTPFEDDLMDVFHEDIEYKSGEHESWFNRFKLYGERPAWTNKLRLRWGKHLKLGLLTHRNQGEEEQAEIQYTEERGPTLGDRKVFSLRIPATLKWYLSLEGSKWRGFSLQRAVLGNYMLAFGQGLVMENTDFFKPRKSGFSWDKRFIGVLGDLSRTEEFALHGIALQGSWRSLDGIFFYSKDKKDAILNPDGSVYSYIIMTPKIGNREREKYGLSPMRDVLKEKTYGGYLRYSPILGSHIGLSFYESLYNRWFDPQTGTVVSRPDKLTTMDSEIFSLYKSPGKFRRLYGVDFQTIYKNLSLQGEYAVLDTADSPLRQNPWAIILSGYLQYENFNLLALYRNYDLSYDNPYCRAFSNYERFKGTILEDQYYLSDPWYGLLYDNSVTPQAEEGLYLSSRYRIAERLIPQIEFDTWVRKADGAHYSRVVAKLEYRLIYPLRFKLRQKWQSRNWSNGLTPFSFNNVSTRLHLNARLSGYDDIDFIYVTTYTGWPPRPRLVDNPEPDGEHPVSGQSAQPSEAIGATFTHNFNQNLTLKTFIGIYDGFFWTFEDNEFLVLDGNSYRYWFSIADRLSPKLSVKFKYTLDRSLPRSYVDARYFNDPWGNDPDAWNVREFSPSFRLQIDYNW